MGGVRLQSGEDTLLSVREAVVGRVPPPDVFSLRGRVWGGQRGLLGCPLGSGPPLMDPTSLEVPNPRACGEDKNVAIGCRVACCLSPESSLLGCAGLP